MTRALAIVNPAAGGAWGAPADLGSVLSRIRMASIAIDVVETADRPNDAESLARRAMRDGYDGVIVAGGDGTVGQAARALYGSEVVLGILPYGTYMNIARSLGVPREPAAAADVIAHRHIRRIDVGVVAGRAFFEAAGIGLDADVVTAGHAMRRGAGGLLRSALASLVRRTSRSFLIEIDGRRFVRRALQATVSNGPYYGWGFAVAPDAVLDDGLLDLVLFSDDRASVLREFARAALGRPFVARGRRFRGRVIRVRSPHPTTVHADGVPVGTLPQIFTVRPQALRVYAPFSPAR